MSALILLHDPNQDPTRSTARSAGLEILQYIMQASVTIFGVAYFCQRRGVTLTELFGKLREPGRRAPAYDFQVPVHVAGLASSSRRGAPRSSRRSAAVPVGRPVRGAVRRRPTRPGYAHDMAPPPGRARQGLAVLPRLRLHGGRAGFLISVIVYVAITHAQTGAPGEGNSPYLVLVGLFVALAAGFGEEMLVTGLTVNALEAAGVGGRRVWLIYLVAVCLRIPFHLYYGWAALGVIIFTVVNIWVYRRWRLLWPIVLVHATYDFVESLGAVTPAVAGLLLLALGLATLVMVIIVLCIESSDRRARHQFERYDTAVRAAEAAYAAQAQVQVQQAQAQVEQTQAQVEQTQGVGRGEESRRSCRRSTPRRAAARRAVRSVPARRDAGVRRVPDRRISPTDARLARRTVRPVAQPVSDPALRNPHAAAAPGHTPRPLRAVTDAEGRAGPSDGRLFRRYAAPSPAG